MKKLISQSELKEFLGYNKETGVFIWGKPISNRVSVGDVAGSISSGGYLRIRVNGYQYQAHQLAWLFVTGAMPDGDIDHINGIRSDNRWCNLRAVGRKENIRNSAIKSTNTSGINGVSWIKRGKKWSAYIKVDGKKIGLGYYSDLMDAENARLQANQRYGFHENHGRAK